MCGGGVCSVSKDCAWLWEITLIMSYVQGEICQERRSRHSSIKETSENICSKEIHRVKSHTKMQSDVNMKMSSGMATVEACGPQEEAPTCFVDASSTSVHSEGAFLLSVLLFLNQVVP